MNPSHRNRNVDKGRKQYIVKLQVIIVVIVVVIVLMIVVIKIQIKIVIIGLDVEKFIFRNMNLK